MTVTALYRAFGADGTLLYIGISQDWARRWVAHAWERPPLYRAVGRLEVSWFPSWEEARAEEVALIRQHAPPYNRADLPRPPKLPIALRWYLDVPPLAPRAPTLSRVPSRSIREVAATLTVAPKTVQNLLSSFKREFPPPTYGKNAQNARIRLLSEADVSVIRELLLVWQDAHTASNPVNP